MLAMSSSSSKIRCRKFLLDEIKDAPNDFGKSKLLGQGGEAKVYRSKVYIKGRNTRVAVKQLHPSSNVLVKEIQTLPKIQHPHIVSLLGYCEESGQKILVYEYMKNGSLSDYVKRKSSICLSWQQRLNICIGAARGLQHLHTGTKEFPFGIVHRDVKPGNILIDTNWVGKVSDFGLFKLSHSGQEKSSMSTDLKGTAGYYAPEYIKFSHVTRKVDVYAFGVVLFEVLCGKMPWDRGNESYQRTDDEDLGLWARDNVDIRIKEEISAGSLRVFTDIIRRSLHEKPSKRPIMDDVVLNLEKVLKRQDQAMYDLLLKLEKMLKVQEHQLDEAELLFNGSTEFLHTGSRHSISKPEQEQKRVERTERKKKDTEHTHQLVKLKSNQEFTCDICLTHSSGTRKHCPQCDIIAHKYCATCPGSQLSFVHPHKLNQVVRHKVTTHRICDVCSKTVKGLFYRCSEDCDFDVHPLCTQ